jgi:S-adenosyl-L-methionine hydrolase (adenosine-forming)
MGRILTFLSDFGMKDAYVAQVKGVILSQLPETQIIDITHDLPPFDIISAGWLLTSSFRFFPSGTVHLAVVDPGVGTGRAILAVRKEGHLFIGPDNGIFSFLYPSDEVLEITWRPQGTISSTFHGRDIFAPLAIKFLSGHGLGAPGMPKKDPVWFDVRSPMVVHVDTFGNVITNVPCDRLVPDVSLEINGHAVSLVVQSFEDIPVKGLGLVCGSASTIEIVANQGHAADMLGVKAGMMVAIFP